MPAKTIEQRREWHRKYYKTPAGKAAINKSNKKWRDKNQRRMKELTTRWRKKQVNHYREKVRPALYKPTRKEPLHCEACGIPFANVRKGSQCDHDHATGLFRGWLCVNCNVALGYAKDSRVILQKLINYLDKAELLA